MKTAVEWYNQQLVERQNGNGDSRTLDEIFEQAKEIEKKYNKETWEVAQEVSSFGRRVISLEDWFIVFEEYWGRKFKK
jgi:ABC-type glycerol-3-phosphate transport system substrate-binding protein